MRPLNGLPKALDVNCPCKRPITNFKRHFCLWRNHKNAHNPRK